MKKRQDVIRIGVAFQYFSSWQGGIDFCINVLRALSLYAKGNDLIEIYCFIPTELSQYTIKEIEKKIELIIDVKRNSPKSTIVFCNEKNYNHLICQYKINVIFPHHGVSAKIKNVVKLGYIPDLQHRTFSQNFKKDDIAKRDREYKGILEKLDYVLVNSNDVKCDLQKYYAPFRAEVVVLPWYPVMSKLHVVKSNSFRKIKAKYNLPDKYFMISNQFWKHKDHLTAFKALEQMYEEGYHDISLVCTGKMEDSRDKRYVPDLLKTVNEMKCKNNILLLGVVPKKEQLCIMRNAIALIQPTLFEGGPGGGAVCDAVSMQVPCIVSDITINKELPKGKRMHYFLAQSENSLTKKMKKVLNINYSQKSNKCLLKIKEKNLQQHSEFWRAMIERILENHEKYKDTCI